MLSAQRNILLKASEFDAAPGKDE